MPSIGNRPASCCYISCQVLKNEHVGRISQVTGRIGKDERNPPSPRQDVPLIMSLVVFSMSVSPCVSICIQQCCQGSKSWRPSDAWQKVDQLWWVVGPVTVDVETNLVKNRSPSESGQDSTTCSRKQCTSAKEASWKCSTFFRGVVRLWWLWYTNGTATSAVKRTPHYCNSKWTSKD